MRTFRWIGSNVLVPRNLARPIRMGVIVLYCRQSKRASAAFNGQPVNDLRMKAYRHFSAGFWIKAVYAGGTGFEIVSVSCLKGIAVTLVSGCMIFVSPKIANCQTSAPELPGSNVFLISTKLCGEMKSRHVLKQGTPVDCSRLRLLRIKYIGFDSKEHRDGELIVLDAVAEEVIQLFGTLRHLRFPIAKIRLMNDFDANDEASMAADNTSAFNVRKITSGKAVSIHSYGLAIDINPIQNPYVIHYSSKERVAPQNGMRYLDRANRRPGMAEPVVDVFANYGFWIWGGDWRNPVDYQHFQVPRVLAKQLARLTPARAKALFEKEVQRYKSCRNALEGMRRARIICGLKMASPRI